MIEQFKKISGAEDLEENIKYINENKSRIPEISKLQKIQNPIPYLFIAYAFVTEAIVNHLISDIENIFIYVAAHIVAPLPSLSLATISAINTIAAYMQTIEILNKMKIEMEKKGGEDKNRYIRLLGPVAARSIGTCTKSGIQAAVIDFFPNDKEFAKGLSEKLFAKK